MITGNFQQELLRFFFVIDALNLFIRGDTSRRCRSLFMYYFLDLFPGFVTFQFVRILFEKCSVLRLKNGFEKNVFFFSLSRNLRDFVDFETLSMKKLSSARASDKYHNCRPIDLQAKVETFNWIVFQRSAQEVVQGRSLRDRRLILMSYVRTR